ncbi:MAG: 3-5 exonuclease [Pseudonocardiales bacterium]|nr:3-5 exonuclease [Pseudonocardiales bacterium]
MSAAAVGPSADSDGAEGTGIESTDVEAKPESTAIPLLAPREGVPEIIVTQAGLDDAIARLVAGTGPLAIDAERASGYRYSQRAYLIQLRRAGAGSMLIDPIQVPDLTALGDAMADVEWIIHAAHQDLPCLIPLGLVPRTLFDSELAGRLLGAHRVALGTMIEERLGYRLEKGHSAADWSTRPLPHDWLIYATLDVELLIELRDALVVELAEAGKTQWALEEFAAELVAPPAPPRKEPWRRTSGIHNLRKPRQLAQIRALWESRDELARARDIAPGRVLPDSAIVAAVRAQPADEDALLAVPVFGGRHQRRLVARWFAALAAARALPDSALPRVSAEIEGPPPPARWREKSPAAAARLAAVRTTITDLAAAHDVEAQNLLAGDVVRRLAWSPPERLDEGAVAASLAEQGSRPWQIALCAAPLAAALQAAEAQASADAEAAGAFDSAATADGAAAADSSAAMDTSADAQAADDGQQDLA